MKLSTLPRRAVADRRLATGGSFATASGWMPTASHWPKKVLDFQRSISGLRDVMPSPGLCRVRWVRPQKARRVVVIR
jgi:hypothetical protein